MAHGDGERRSQSPARAEKESRRSGETKRELSDCDGGSGRTMVGVEEAHTWHGFGSGSSGCLDSGYLVWLYDCASVVGGHDSQVLGKAITRKGLSR